MVPAACVEKGSNLSVSITYYSPQESHIPRLLFKAMFGWGFRHICPHLHNAQYEWTVDKRTPLEYLSNLDNVNVGHFPGWVSFQSPVCLAACFRSIIFACHTVLPITRCCSQTIIGMADKGCFFRVTFFKLHYRIPRLRRGTVRL